MSKEFFTLLKMSPIVEKMTNSNLKFQFGDKLIDAKELYSRIDELKTTSKTNKMSKEELNQNESKVKPK